MFLAPLNYDKFFKKVFSDERISKKFLEDFLDVKIEEFEMLKGKHKVTDDAAVVEFDFRCKIDNAYVIIDMQQWYKRDIGQRFYLYHAVNTGLQLEKLPEKRLVLDKLTQKLKKVKDYSSLEPVLTLIWMGDDSLGFTNDYVAYAMTPEIVVDFMKNEKLWHNPEIIEIIRERARVLKVLENKSKGLRFLSKNRLIFLLQKNIVKNKSLAKYERWFKFAEKTKDGNNKEEDFKEYMNDEIFCEIIRRLSRSELNEEDIIYIENEKKFWEEVERLERGIYKEGLEEGMEEGLKKGLEKGLEEGIEIGKNEGEKSKALEIAKKLKGKGIDYRIISETSGLTAEEIEKL